MPRKFRSRNGSKKKENNFRAALHQQRKAHIAQFGALLSEVDETQQVVTRLIDSYAEATSRRTESSSTAPAPSPSSQAVAEEDLRSRLNERAAPQQPDDLRHTLDSKKRPKEPSPRRRVRERSRSPASDRTAQRRKD